MGVSLEWIVRQLEDFKNEQVVSKYAKAEYCREVIQAVDRAIEHLKRETTEK